MTDCIFCKIVQGDIPSFKVYEDERVFAFMDINPISAGHCLIIPKNHAENLWEIAEEDLKAIHAASKKLATALKKVLNAEGIAVLQLNGRAVNQVVMHYHLHLMPNPGEGQKLKLTQWELIPGNMDQLKDLSARIGSAL